MELKKRELSGFDYIVTKHIYEFEKGVLNCYFDYLENSTDSGRLPSLVDDIIYNVDPKFMLAGIMSEEYEDEEAFFTATKNMSLVDMHEFVVDEFEKYFSLFDSSYNMSMSVYHGDIEKVLDFHNLSFVNSFGDPFSNKIHLYLQNSPIKGVW